MAKKIISKEKKGESTKLHNLKADKPTDLKIGYIGGGSRGWAHALMKDLVTCPHFNGEIRLYDIDREMAQFNAEYGNWLQKHPAAISKWKYKVVKSLKECVTGTDFIFCSIQPGPIQYMKVDLEEPMKYGIYQPVGDTVGPGGCIRGLRAIKDYRVFAQAIGEYAPQTWTVNFTNPMTLCTRTLYEEFPGIKAYGCCHEVFGTQRLLGELYSEATGKEQPDRQDVKVNVLGINHFTWLDKAECHGMDLLKLLDKHLDKSGVLKKSTKKQTAKGNNWFVSRRQVAFELYKRFGVLAAAGDRHLAEFVPWFLTSEDSCYRWGFRLTPYSYRINRFKNAPKESKKNLKSGKYPELNSSGEEYMNQMLALVGKTSFRTNVNMPNRGQLGKIPSGAVVETNSLFSRNSVEPVVSGALPDNTNGLVLKHVLNQETLIKAVFNRNKDLAFQAFINDPLVGRLGMDDAWKLFNTMISKTKFEF